MVCEKCKQEIPGGFSFCPYCGARFDDASRREEIKRERQRDVEEEKRRENERRSRENEELDRLEQAAIEREKLRDKQTIEVDPRKIRLYDKPDDDYDDMGGFGSFGGGLFGDIFGGGMFGNFFGGGRRNSFGRASGGGLFDIIDSIFGGGFGAQQQRPRLKAEDDYYYQDPVDEDGIPVLDEDEVIDLTPKELERRNREFDRKRKLN